MLITAVCLEQVARVMIEAKANINHSANDGRTALMQAAKNGHEGCAQELLKANADPNKAANNGFTALMLSCQNGHLEVSCPTQTATLALALAHPEPQANGQRSFALSRSLENCSRQEPTETKRCLGLAAGMLCNLLSAAGTQLSVIC